MMPVVRLNDATFVDLKSISTWLGTRTPSETIDSLVQEKMKMLDLERDMEEDSVVINPAGDRLVFGKTPGLSFTRILSASVNNQKIEKINWAGLLLKVVGLVKAQGLTREQLVHELQIPTRASNYTRDGYKFQPELGISIQGQSAPDAWKEVSRLAQKYRIPVEVHFQWRENNKAQHPGRVGIIRAGS